MIIRFPSTGQILFLGIFVNWRPNIHIQYRPAESIRFFRARFERVSRMLERETRLDALRDAVSRTLAR